MIKLIGLSIVLSITASSLMAWNYYPDNYGYSYTRNWRYPSSYSEGCPQDGRQNFGRSPTTTASQYQEQPQQQIKSLEQQYANLIVMFTKDDCGFCRYMLPIMKQVERKFGKDIKFLYVDVAQYPQYPKQYGFSTVPHIVYFKDGEQLHAHGSGDRTITAKHVEEKIRTLGMRKANVFFQNSPQ